MEKILKAEQTAQQKTIDKASNSTIDQIILGHMSQKIMVDKFSKEALQYIVFSSPNFEDNDWVSKIKLTEIIDKLGEKKESNYVLKKRMKGNRDENKRPQDGKALKLIREDKIVSVSIYILSSQEKEEKYRHSHTHLIDKNVFEAYVLAMQNDTSVAKKEAIQRSIENSSLQLD